MNWDNLKEDYERLGSMRKVARLYGCRDTTIAAELRRQGVEIPVTNTGRKYVWTDERRANHKASTNTLSFKEAHRVSLLKRFNTLRSSATDSPLEKLLHAALSRAGVSYTTQQVKLGKYSVDIELLQAKVIIEADGFSHRLERQQAKDKIRDAELSEAGYEVFRFTGTEINADVDDCIRLVLNKTGVTSDINPIADIRRQGVGPDNMNWKGGKAKLVCLHCHEPFESYRSNAKFCKMLCYNNYRKQVMV